MFSTCSELPGLISQKDEWVSIDLNTFCTDAIISKLPHGDGIKPLKENWK